MTRIAFTNKITSLLRMMIVLGENPIIDFVKRTEAEQRRLFDAGLSKCDGINIVSNHQFGKAMDIYFIDPATSALADPIKGFAYWHEKWVEMGGNPMIEWDQGHFD